MRIHEARSNLCVLMQSLPPVSRVAPFAETNLSVCVEGRARTSRSRYDIRTCITHIDRAIIRGYLHEYRSPSTTRLLPPELEHKLSVLPAGYERILADDDVLLVQTATHRIADVMRNACAADNSGRGAMRKRGHTQAPINRPGSAVEDKAARWRLFEHVSTL